MSQHDQVRWQALIDREAIGEALDLDEREFVERYEAEHPELARERAIFEAAIASLHDQLDPDQDDELTLAREAAAALERYRSTQPEQPASAPSTARSGAGRLWWIAGVAAAAGLIGWLGLRKSEDEPKLGTDERVEQPHEQAPPKRPQPIDPSPTPGAPVDPVGRLSMVVDAEIPLGRPFAPGDDSAKLLGPDGEFDRACVSWSEPTAVVCFEGTLSASASGQGERRVRLESGRLVAALAPLGPGQRFTVETMVGTVSAIGTVFAVEIYEGRAWVTVLEGRVELRDPTVRALAAGQRTSLRGEVPGDEPTPLSADSTPTALAQLVDVAELLRASPGDALVNVPSTGNRVLQIDDRPIEGPARLALSSGAHALRLLDEHGEVVVEQDSALVLGETLELGEQLASELATGEAKPSVRPAPSAKQLAEAAQRNRMARNYKETARLYRELLDRYPDSPEAANVPVRLGDLLSSTGDHKGALEAYELYLERGAKQLAPEAEFGRIRALRALGRKADERAAIEAFIEARPGDYRSAELKDRLAEL